MAGTPKAFGEPIAREIPRWAEVVKAANVKPELTDTDLTRRSS
jgi:hypothetical protein